VGRARRLDSRKNGRHFAKSTQRASESQGSGPAPATDEIPFGRTSGLSMGARKPQEQRLLTRAAPSSSAFADRRVRSRVGTVSTALPHLSSPLPNLRAREKRCPDGLHRPLTTIIAQFAGMGLNTEESTSKVWPYLGCSGINLPTNESTHSSQRSRA
jgi:hypothetical protein